MKKLQIAFLAFVLAACALPAVLLLCGFKNANRENRPLAQMPKLVSEGALNLKFSQGFDKFIDDNFALREYLITACNTASAKVMGDYNGQSAVIGKNGYLYYSESCDDYLGINCLTDDMISSAADYLYALQEELAGQGRSFVFIVAPNKATVYSEYMPDYLKPTDAQRNIKALQQELKNRGVNFIDAAALLESAKQSYDLPLYYMRDSHWNNLGACLVYNALAERIGLERYDESAFTAEADYSGDLVNFVYPAAPHYEQRLVYTFPREYTAVDHQVNFDMFKVNETESQANDVTLLMYHDSFGKSLQPFFSPAVGRLVMLKSNSPIYSAGDAMDYEADAVIIELVERNLDLLYEYAARNGY